MFSTTVTWCPLSPIFMHYNPGQEMCIDEAMVRYKSHMKGKIHMPGRFGPISMHYNPGQEMCIDEAMVRYKSHMKGKIHMPGRFGPISMHYNPGQEMCIDEAMDIKHKSHMKGNIHMPKKFIKMGFRIWCCCYSCYSMGKPMDLSTGKQVSEKGMVKKVVLELVGPFSGLNQVLYLDSYFTSGSLVEELYEKQIYVAGTIQQRDAGFPNSLKDTRPARGSYAVERVGNMFSMIVTWTNSFPEHMEDKVVRVHTDGVLRYQSIPLLLPA